MQTIETKYVGASNFRGSRIIATASGSRTRVIVSYESQTMTGEDAHIEAARQLCAKMNWFGNLVGGHTKSGMVFVFDAPITYRLSIPRPAAAPAVDPSPAERAAALLTRVQATQTAFWDAERELERAITEIQGAECELDSSHDYSEFTLQDLLDGRGGY